ncbi:rhodanese-like domain-containing protein [Crassaminicella profunda]|uniref:rhodanese-like domain-containing protein n=1 Tax=Crassaminicella profunda TaxID=1286698 RepID=UPI001CA5FBB9|nr:rhodanese-like domain-containing protein [Crassaminicella profunda]QZY55358.1 rhodanese-like domain-containing protein [Crassaminicella profunda]
MLKIFVLKKRTLYIALAILVIFIIGILVLVMSNSDETFSETMKYAYKTISAEQAKVLLEKNSDVTVFDIRDEEEYVKNHLPSATQLTYKELKKKLDYYGKDSIYMIYGKDDKQSAKAADMMASSGFSKIYMLTGGIEKWPYELD